MCQGLCWALGVARVRQCPQAGAETGKPGILPELGQVSEKVRVAPTNSGETMYPKLFSHVPSRWRPQAHTSRRGFGASPCLVGCRTGGQRNFPDQFCSEAMGDAKTELYSWDPDPGLNLDSSTHFLQALGESILFAEPLSPGLSLGGGDIAEVKLLRGCYRFKVYISAPRFTRRSPELQGSENFTLSHSWPPFLPSSFHFLVFWPGLNWRSLRRRTFVTRKPAPWLGGEPSVTAGLEVEAGRQLDEDFLVTWEWATRIQGAWTCCQPACPD